MSVKVAINGFGRIGRAVFKAGIDDPEIEFVAINDLLSGEELSYLLKYDSVYGKFDKEVELKDGNLFIDGKEVKLLQEKDPTQLPWSEMGVDIACESTGIFRTKDEAAQHLEAGAKKVLISAPAKGEKDVVTVNYGINFDIYDKDNHDVISNASCTTNSVTPMATVLDKEFGIKSAFLNTIHSYTGTQNLVDGPSSKPRRRRAAAANIIPTTTGAATDVAKVIPELKGKLSGLAMRVPLPCGSISDFTVTVEKEPAPGEVNEKLKEYSEGELEGVLGYTDEPIVSSDILQDPHSSIVDSEKTMQEDNLVKVLGWYDNEWGYSSRCIDLFKELL